MPELFATTPQPLLPSVPPKRGRLKIFLGYSAGVGKTFRMLDEARRRKERGEDVVVAACQPGAQAEVRTLLDQLETIPTLRTSLGEGLHMDAILRRHPAVCVIDPLARKNAEGFRNAQRWQDIEELLARGISVLTAVNLLHIAEYREHVEAITGKHTNETVPRDFLARADEFVLVDVPTDSARERGATAAGSSRVRDERGEKLAALREMALVLAADVAERQLESYLTAQGVPLTWGMHERILVCLTPHSSGEAMIASGKRNQARFQGELHVVHVRRARQSYPERKRIQELLAVATEAGAEVRVLESDDPAAAILEYAREKKITQIFVGHSGGGGRLARLRRGPLERLLAGAENADVRIFPH